MDMIRQVRVLVLHGTKAFMFDDAVVILIKAKEAFGRHGENAKESSVSIEDISKYHVTVAIEECIEVLSSDGKPDF